jgi:nitrogenase molybdenum-cofactor synthesis protein NifE
MRNDQCSGGYDFKNFKKLSEIDSDKLIKTGSAAIEPGPRCPLAVVNTVLQGIKDAHMLVVGTAECTYYNRNNSIRYHIDSSNITTWSYCLDSKEVIFGCKKGVMEALEEITKNGVKALFLVSTCVPETIGEDFEGIVRQANKSLSMKIIYIDGAHFRGYGAMLAKEATLYSLHAFIEKQEIKKETVNLIGDDADRIKGSELITLLQKHGVEIHRTIPYDLSVEQLRTASSAALSIILDATAIPLAEKMAESFGTPYVFMPHLLDLEQIRDAYLQIGNYLGIQFAEEIENLYARAKEKVKHSINAFKGKKLACGYFPINPFVVVSFLTSLGMNAVYLETEYYSDKDKYWSAKILEQGSDPYIGRIFNHTTSMQVLEAIEIDCLLIHNLKLKLPANSGIVAGEGAVSKLGFEQPIALMDEIALAMNSTLERGEQDGTI